MKHLIIDNQIIQSGLPSQFERPNGELFCGGYENMTELHYEDGWRDEVVPEYDPKLQYVADRYYDEFDDVVTYTILDIVVDVEYERTVHMNNLAALRQEIAMVVMQIKLSNETDPELLTQISPMIRGLYAYAKEEISSLTVENVRDYILRGPQVEQLFLTLNSML